MKHSKFVRRSVFIIPISMFLLSHLALAEEGGAHVGNGGDAFVCKSGKVFLLDYYEALKRGFQIDLGPKTLSAREKVNLILGRIKHVDPVRSEEFRVRAYEILDDTEIFEKNSNANPGKNVRFTNDPLSDVDDSKETSTPKGCEKIQAVIQSTPRFSEDRRYEISIPIWIAMNSSQRALTVMHEVWYREGIETGAPDSRGARYMNGFMASTNAIEPDLAQYLKNFKASGFHRYIVQLVQNGDFQFYNKKNGERFNRFQIWIDTSPSAGDENTIHPSHWDFSAVHDKISFHYLPYASKWPYDWVLDLVYQDSAANPSSFELNRNAQLASVSTELPGGGPTKEIHFADGTSTRLWITRPYRVELNEQGKTTKIVRLPSGRN